MTTTVPSAADALWQATAALHATGEPLMARVFPRDSTAGAWRHYPKGDVINGVLGARWFYHCHAPGERAADEHGHFHLFIARRAMPRNAQPMIAPPAGRRPRPSTVHVAALAIDRQGLPLRWFATNRWVTNEWLYPADCIGPLLSHIAFDGPQGDCLVNAWLSAMLRASIADVAAMLLCRDATLMRHDPGGEDRAVEVVASVPIDLDVLLE